MTGPRRAVVTGAGAVTPLGASLDATRHALASGASGLSTATLLEPAGFQETRAGEVRDLDTRRFFRVPKAMKLTDRRTRFAVAAASMALSSSGLSLSAAGRERLGVLLATTGSDLAADDLARALSNDPEGRAVTDVPTFAERVVTRLNPLWLLVNLPNMASAHVAIQLEARGPNSTVMTGIAGGLQALGEAAAWIARGDADAVLAGGADAPVHVFAWAGFEQAGLFAPDSSDPEARFVPGEGAAVCLLEPEEAARARGARILGTVLGLGSAAGPSGDPSPLARSLRAALRQAGVEPEALAAVALTVPRSGGFPAAARAALEETLGPRATLAPPLESTPRTGHLLAASAALDALLALHVGPGPVLAASLGYSGDAAALVLSAPEEGTS